MYYRLITFIALFTILVATILAYNGAGVIHEDDVRWDCKTMGNLICGGK